MKRDRLALGAGILVVLALVALIVPLGERADPAGASITKVERASWRPRRDKPLFIAVLGSDAREGPPNASGGCDAVHIIGINPTRQAGTILNFPRDSFLGGRKLTDICRQSGFEGAISVLKSHTGIRIQYLVRTEFSHFRDLITELGGIEVDVPYAMFDSPSGADFDAGRTKMNGDQALAFSRNRKNTPNGDFSRTENQGRLIIAALKKFRAEMSMSPHRLVNYLAVLRRHVSFSIPIRDVVVLALVASTIHPARLKNVNVPGTAGAAGAASVVFLSPGDTYGRVRDDAVY